jgi:hypothetical protein
LSAPNRVNWGGDTNLEFRDLPAGMTPQIVPMPGNRTDTLVLFSARCQLRRWMERWPIIAHPPIRT